MLECALTAFAAAWRFWGLRGDRDGRTLDVTTFNWSYATRRAIQKELTRQGLYAGMQHGLFNAATRRRCWRSHSLEWPFCRPRFCRSMRVGNHKSRAALRAV